MRKNQALRIQFHGQPVCYGQTVQAHSPRAIRPSARVHRTACAAAASQLERDNRRFERIRPNAAKPEAPRVAAISWKKSKKNGGIGRAQLLHRASQKFVSVMPRVMAEGEKDCFQVYLSPEGGEGCAL